MMGILEIHNTTVSPRSLRSGKKTVVSSPHLFRRMERCAPYIYTLEARRTDLSHMINYFFSLYFAFSGLELPHVSEKARSLYSLLLQRRSHNANHSMYPDSHKARNFNPTI